MIFKPTVLFLAIIFVCLLPHTSQAFSPSDIKAIQVNDQSFLFMVEYRLGYEKYDLDVPMFDSKFTISATEPTVQVSDTAALTLSDEAEVKDDRYQVEAGSDELFTFLAVVTLEQPLIAGTGLKLQFTEVPFTLLDSTGTRFDNGLSAGELQSFQAELPAKESEL